MSASSASVLRRKIAGHAPPAPAMTIEKALRLAAAQAGDRALGVAVSAEDAQVSGGTAEEVAAALSEPGLILRLSGPSGRMGLLSFCASGLAALVEAATLGRISGADPVLRRGTPVDAALAETFADALLSALAPRLGQLEAPPPVGGYACQGWVPGPRAAALILCDAPHSALSAKVLFGDAGRAARMLLICPDPQPDRIAGPAAQSWHASWTSRIMGAEARISADIATIELSAAALARLAPGQLIDLPRASIDRITLRAPGRVPVGEARLGRIGALRAVRLKSVGMTTRAPVAQDAPDAVSPD